MSLTLSARAAARRRPRAAGRVLQRQPAAARATAAAALMRPTSRGRAARRPRSPRAICCERPTVRSRRVGEPRRLRPDSNPTEGAHLAARTALDERALPLGLPARCARTTGMARVQVQSLRVSSSQLASRQPGRQAGTQGTLDYLTDGVAATPTDDRPIVMSAVDPEGGGNAAAPPPPRGTGPGLPAGPACGSPAFPRAPRRVCRSNGRGGRRCREQHGSAASVGRIRPRAPLAFRILPGGGRGTGRRPRFPEPASRPTTDREFETHPRPHSAVGPHRNGPESIGRARGARPADRGRGLGGGPSEAGRVGGRAGRRPRPRGRATGRARARSARPIPRAAAPSPGQVRRARGARTPSGRPPPGPARPGRPARRASPRAGAAGCRGARRRGRPAAAPCQGARSPRARTDPTR